MSACSNNPLMERMKSIKLFLLKSFKKIEWRACVSIAKWPLTDKPPSQLSFHRFLSTAKKAFVF